MLSLIMSFYLHLVLTSGLFTSRASEALVCSLCCPLRATCPAHLILFDFITPVTFDQENKSCSSSTCNFSSLLLLNPLLHLRPNIYILFSTLFSNTRILLSMCQTKPHAHTKQRAKWRFCIFPLSCFSVPNATTKYVFWTKWQVTITQLAVGCTTVT
jgi:hypothetical protein